MRKERIKSGFKMWLTDDDLEDDEPYVDFSPGGGRAVVRRTAETAADRTGDDDLRDVSSHGLRRRFAQRLLVDKGIPRRDGHRWLVIVSGDRTVSQRPDRDCR